MGTPAAITPFKSWPNSVQTPIWEGALKLLDELPQPGEEEGVKGAVNRIRVTGSMALQTRCAHGTTS